MFTDKIVVFLAAVAVCQGAPNGKFSNKRLGLGIDGGVDVKIEDYPFLVSVQAHIASFIEHICGGVIVNEYWVLTSAACIYSGASSVVVGSADLKGDDKVTVNVEAAYGHPNASRIKYGPNDIGLLKLSTALTFNDKVQAAKLTKQGQEFNGEAVAVGYGGNKLLPYDIKTLKAVFNVTLISSDDCSRTINQLNPDLPSIDGSNLCTLNKASNNCNGDMGGPLLQDGTVIGTVSWYVSPCGIKGVPNIYTKLSNFIDWINQTITEYS